MTLNKQAQHLDGFHVSTEELRKFLDTDFSTQDQGDLQVEIEIEPENEEEELFLSSEPEIHGEVEIEVGDSHKHIALPFVPGADDQTDIEEPEEEEEVQDLAEDPWKWTLESFVSWAPRTLQNVPRHSGRDIPGILRAISYLQHFVKECDKASKADINGKIDNNFIAKIRTESLDGIKRLKERLEKIEAQQNPKKKKKAELESEGELVKEARMPHIQVQVPLFISSLARSIINGTIANGKDSEKLFRFVVGEYSLNKREQTELMQLLTDWGLLIPISTDLALPRDTKSIDPRSESNVNWAPVYNA
jgi:hypothetical protein